MNAKQWREKGFKTIFRDGAIYIVRIEYKPSAVAVAAFVTAVNNGCWMSIPESEVTFSRLCTNLQIHQHAISQEQLQHVIATKSIQVFAIFVRVLALAQTHTKGF